MRMRSADPPGVDIVGAIKNRAAGLIEKLAKDLVDCGQIGIKIEMLFLDVKDERMFRIEEADGAVALIAFGHKILAAWIPMRIRTEQGNRSANIVGWVGSALPENMGRHGGGCRLAVHSCDPDAPF